MQVKRKYSKPTLDVHEIDNSISLIMMSLPDPGDTTGPTDRPTIPGQGNSIEASNFEYASFDQGNPFEVQSFR